MNYTELKAAVQAYIESDFPETTAGSLSSTEQLDIFIRQAEQRIMNGAQLLELRKNVTGNLTTSNRYLSLPSDWLDTYSLAVIDSSGVYYHLLNKDVGFIREAYPDPTATGQPKFYAFFDKDSILVAPTPDDDYSVELHYFYYPTSIVDASTSWLGDNFDSVLLYGTLLEAATFVQAEEDVMATYRARYDEAFKDIKRLAEGKNRQDFFRNEEPRSAL